MAEQPRTVFAQKALDFAQLFALAFGEAPIVSGGVTYRLEISSPEGPSTGGGVQGVQHMTLVPQAAGNSIVVGSANRTRMTAQLRSFALLVPNHDRRSPGTDLGLDGASYGALVKRLAEFFSNQSMTLTMDDVAPGSTPVAIPRQSSRVALFLVIGMGLLLLAVVAWFVASRAH